VSNTAEKMVIYGKSVACYTGDNEGKGQCRTCSESFDDESCLTCVQSTGEKLQTDKSCFKMTIEILKQFEIILESSVTNSKTKTSIATFSEDLDPKYNITGLVITLFPEVKNVDPLAEYNSDRRRRLSSVAVDNSLENIIFTDISIIKNQIILKMDTSYMDSDLKSPIKLSVPPSQNAGTFDVKDPSIMFNSQK